MTIRAIVFDIGGVLEMTPDLGMTERWEKNFNLKAGELNERMGSFWQAGSLGECSEEDVSKGLRTIMGMNEEQIEAFWHDLWEEYLGTLNVELATYFASLRPRYQTAILSNSFVGSREQEQEQYHFPEMTDFIVYSHEVGMAKPDRRIYALTCERLGLSPEEVIFLDDSEVCITGAREYGMHAILFQNNTQAIAEIQALLDMGSC